MVIAMLVQLVLIFIFPPFCSTQCCCCGISTLTTLPMYPPMSAGMMGGGIMSGYGLGAFPDYGPSMYGTGSPWAAGGGLIGNALSFLVG